MLVLLLSLLNLLATAQDCEKYLCQTSEQKFAEHQCILSDGKDYWLKPCTDPSLPHCPPLQNGIPGDVFCTASPPAPPAEKYPGELCTTNADCVAFLSTGCVGGIC